MPQSVESALQGALNELQTLYDGVIEGILITDIRTKRLVRANHAICESLGYTQDELLARSVHDIHPEESLPRVFRAIDNASRHGTWIERAVPFRCKNGNLLYMDAAVRYHSCKEAPLVIGFFQDVSEQNHAAELLRQSEDRYRLIAENVTDIIWTSPISLTEEERALAKKDLSGIVDLVLDRFSFSFISPALERVFGYTPEDIQKLTMRDLLTPSGYTQLREAFKHRFSNWKTISKQRPSDTPLVLEFLAKDGTARWCEVAGAYLSDKDNLPAGILGITRDVSSRLKTEHALRESENKLRRLFENLPDLVMIVNRQAVIQFINRDAPHLSQNQILGKCATDLIAKEHQAAFFETLQQTILDAAPRTVEFMDVYERWWSFRMVSPAEDNDSGRVILIGTDFTKERMAMEAVHKEQRLLRQLLDLHERERQLVAYDIHDGFAQQITGAMYRLQGFREMHPRDPDRAWKDFDVGVNLIRQAIDETRRLISGLRPPILDESGIVDAIDYLVCERQSKGNTPTIDFEHDVTFYRLAPPLESALFRIVQESLQNACRHSKTNRILIRLTDRNGWILLSVRDWGVGFDPNKVEENHFGLQGMRERVRLLGGHVAIESSPKQGTTIHVELPLVKNTEIETPEDDE